MRLTDQRKRCKVPTANLDRRSLVEPTVRVDDDEECVTGKNSRRFQCHVEECLRKRSVFGYARTP